MYGRKFYVPELADENDIEQSEKEEDDAYDNGDVEKQSFDSAADMEAGAPHIAPTTKTSKARAFTLN